MSRVVAALVIAGMLAPVSATITCDVVCALGADRATAPMDMATCHEHQAHHSGPAAVPTSSGPCHDSADMQAAVLADSLQLTALAAPPAAASTMTVERVSATPPPFAHPRTSESPPPISQLRI